MSPESQRKDIAVHELLTEIYQNANASLKAAQLLNENGCSGYAVHLAIICWEECSKYLLTYCVEHLPQGYFKSRYKHASKISLASGIYFLSGAFSAAYFVERLNKAGKFEGGDSDLAAIVASSLQHFGYGNPERLAESLLNHLTEERTDEQRVAIEESFAAVEKLRTQSVYVDFSDDFSLQGSPSRISEHDVSSWLENAKFGVGMLDFLRSERADLHEFIAVLLKHMREDVEAKVGEMLKKVESKTRPAII